MCPELTRDTIPKSRDVGHFLSVTGTVIRTSTIKVTDWKTTSFFLIYLLKLYHLVHSRGQAIEFFCSTTKNNIFVVYVCLYVYTHTQSVYKTFV